MMWLSRQLELEGPRGLSSPIVVFLCWRALMVLSSSLNVEMLQAVAELLR